MAKMAPLKYYHLVPEADWRSCVEHGKAYLPATYEADGFTHLSDNREVLLTIGNHFCKQVSSQTDTHTHFDERDRERGKVTLRSAVQLPLGAKSRLLTHALDAFDHHPPQRRSLEPFWFW